MSLEQWSAVDGYIAEKLLGDDDLAGILKSNSEAGLPAIDVSPSQGKLLYLLAKLCGARRILEIGTLGAYSTIWMARALPSGGELVSLEIDPHHAAVARSNCLDAGVGDRVDIRVGPALEALDQLAAESKAAFDLVFIDADKQNNAPYVERAIGLAREGTLIIVDNVVRDGGVLDGQSSDPMIAGTRRLFDLLSSETSLEATAIQTVGIKGWDGLVIARVAGRR
jgi:predicted O-methyltransferase YrrM